MQIRSLIQAVAIAAGSLTMAGASWSPACAQGEDPLYECIQNCYAVYGPYGTHPNSNFLQQCRYRCCEMHGGC